MDEVPSIGRTEATPSGRRPARLLFLGHGAERTGPPILLGHLLRGLAETRDHDLSVWTARPGPLLEEYRAAGARAETASGGREPLEPLAAALRRIGAPGLVGPLQARVRSRKARALPPADLVYVNAATPPTAALLRALSPPSTVKVVLHVHELDVGLRLTLDPDDLALLLGRADHVVSASESVTDVLTQGHGVARSRISTCPGFVELGLVDPSPPAEARVRVGIPPEALVVGSVGLPDWRKDPEHLLHAVTHLRWSHPQLDPWVLWIGGEPNSVDGRRLADEAHRVGLGHRFVHHPHTDRPDHLLGALDVFAVPAREDALPLAALEAGAAGLPLVCFRTGGIAALADAGAGTAVEYPDVVAFAAALADYLLDDERRSEVGSCAAALVAARHARPAGVERIAAVIDRALAEGPAARVR